MHKDARIQEFILQFIRSLKIPTHLGPQSLCQQVMNFIVLQVRQVGTGIGRLFIIMSIGSKVPRRTPGAVTSKPRRLAAITASKSIIASTVAAAIAIVLHAAAGFRRTRAPTGIPVRNRHGVLLQEFIANGIGLVKVTALSCFLTGLNE